MTRYFFDVASKTHTQYDYRGREFSKLDKAREWAELIALDLQCCDDGAWIGFEIRVHETGGGRLFSIPVREFELRAA
jgi:uncharacterized protein DUF6894